MQVPWYYGEDAATLKHQRPQPEKQKQFSDRNEWFKKGVKEVGKKLIYMYTGPDKQIKISVKLFAF